MTINVGMNYFTPIWQGTKNAAKVYGKFVFGTQNELFSKNFEEAVRGVKDPVTKKRIGGSGINNFWKNIKDSWAKADAVAIRKAGGKSFWRSNWESLKGIPKGFKASYRLAKQTGKYGKIFGGSLKTLGKRMPLIGNLLMVGLEVPNLYRAFTQGGIGTGTLEIGKAAAKLGGFAAGAAVGQALIPIPFVGAMIGGLVGNWLATKIVGKSFTEKQEEKKLASTGTAHIQEQAQVAPEQMQTQIANSQTAVQDNTAVDNPNADMTQELLKMAGGGQTQSTQNVQNNPFAQGQYAANPFMSQQYGMNNQMYSQSFMDEDFMAMGAGLNRRS